ncbi:MAG: TIGR02301 family protein [Pseudomonadota bacterium]
MFVRSVIAAIGLMFIASQSPASADYAAYKARQETLVRLAGLLGQTHHVRSLCVAEENEVWRRRMAKLLDLEDPPQKQRNAMVQAFNDGFYKARRAHAACTEDTRKAAARLGAEGRTLSNRLKADVQSN